MPLPARNKPVAPPAHLSQVVGEVLKIEGPLNLANMPRLLSESEAYSRQDNLPECLAIDFSNVKEVDSSAVALMLHWRRQALQLNKALRYVNLPANLASLSQLYGVEDMINCPGGGAAAGCPDALPTA